MKSHDDVSRRNPFAEDLMAPYAELSEAWVAAWMQPLENWQRFVDAQYRQWLEGVSSMPTPWLPALAAGRMVDMPAIDFFLPWMPASVSAGRGASAAVGVKRVEVKVVAAEPAVPSRPAEPSVAAKPAAAKRVKGGAGKARASTAVAPAAEAAASPSPASPSPAATPQAAARRPRRTTAAAAKVAKPEGGG